MPLEEKKAKLEFTVEESDSGLVFEGNVEKFPRNAPPRRSSQENYGQNKKQFDVPDKFSVNKKYDTLTSSPSDKTLKVSENQEKKPEKSVEKPQEKIEEAPKIRTTYVPRFTEISETYRMSDGKPKENKEAKKKPEVVVVKDDTVEQIDPTAELEEHKVDDATVVTVGAPAPEVFEIQSTVFKFEEKPAPAPSPEPKIEEDVPEDDDEELEPIEEDIPAPIEEPKEYKLPDPPQSPAPAAPPIAAVSEVPANIGDESQSNGKRTYGEYTAISQRESFKDRFLDTLMSIKVRLIASVVILVAALVFENLSLFGIDVPTLFGISTVRGAMAIIDAQLVIALLILAMPEVITAFHRVFLGKATPELFIPTTAVVLIAYYVTVVVTVPSDSYPLFGLLYGLLTVSAITATYLRRSADFSNFKLIATPAEKRIVDRKLTRTLTEEHLAVDGRVEGYKSKTARVFRTAFVADFNKRSGKSSENSNNVIIILAAVFGIAFVAAAVAFFIPPGGFFVAMTAFTAVFMLGVPAFTVLTHKLPFFHSVKAGERESSAVIGEGALYDYSGVDVVTFRDTEVFGDEDINLQRIMLYGRSENLEKAMRQMSALFTVVGGPLEIMFSDSLDHTAPRASGVKIENEGIVGRVDGKEVRAGTLEYMVKNGIKIPYDPTKEASSLFSTKIMYAAEAGEVYAKFYIRYTLSEDFTMILPSLCDDGVVPLIYTRDPNINNELLRTLTAGSDSIRVLKRQTLPDGEDKLYHRVSAGLVTTGNKINVINMLLLSKKYVGFQNRMAVTELLAMGVGSILAATLSLSGMIGVPSLLLVLWHVAWCAALAVISKKTISTTHDKRDKKKK